MRKLFAVVLVVLALSSVATSAFAAGNGTINPLGQVRIQSGNGTINPLDK